MVEEIFFKMVDQYIFFIAVSSRVTFVSDLAPNGKEICVEASAEP